jgi:hypothetical protein
MKKTLLDKFFDALQPQPQMPEVMKHIPLFRYPMNYGYTIPQLDLISTFDDQVYLLEWTIPGQANRQTNIHIIKTVTKKDLQKLFLETPLGDLTLFDIFNPNDGDAYNNLKMGPINTDDYYETAELKPINRYLIRNRLNNISNQPLVSSRNVASTSIPKIKSMLQ